MVKYHRETMRSSSKTFFTLILGLTLLVFLSGCTLGGEKEVPKDPGLAQDETIFPMTIRDQMDREIVIEELPERIVSLSPSNTEILYALGLEDQLVGVTDFCQYPEEVEEKDKVGGFADPNIEVIVSLKPNIVLTTDLHQQVVEQLEAMGIPSIVLNPQDMEEMLESIEIIGEMAGALDKAQALTSDLKSRIDEVAQKRSQIPEDKRPRVYYEIFPDPLISAGPNTFVDDIIRLAGGINIASDAAKPYPEYSQEMIIAKNPEIIIFSHHGTSQETAKDILSRPGWESIDALQTERVFYIDEDLLQLATPRLIEGLELVTDLLEENFGR